MATVTMPVHSTAALSGVSGSGVAEAGAVLTNNTGASTNNEAGGSTPSTSNAPQRIYGKIVLTTENVLISKDKIEETPSRLDGMDAMTEWELRVVGCELISTCGILLKLPQTAMATGQVLFHRFYYCKSFLRQDMEHAAMACIYLASKIEEAPRRIRDVINVFHHIQQLRNGKTAEPLLLNQQYIEMKSEVTLVERRVLKELGFCVHVKHPHKLIVVYLQQLGYDRDSQFLQMSWNYMSDSLRTNVFVRYKPEVIACACIYLSARRLKIPLPNNPAWYLVFDAEEEQILDISECILDLYERPRIDYDQFFKKYKAMKKAYKDSKSKDAKERAKAVAEAEKLALDPNATAVSPHPTSRPSSPNPGSEGSGGTVNSKEPKDKVEEKSDNDSSKKYNNNSPGLKKSRRTPSPIYYDLSPPRQSKKKKRRKSRSDSGSPSRSKERRLAKKQSKRDKSRSRSRSPYSPKRSHHKKKSHHRDRYRSRSRSYSPLDDRYDRYEKYYKKSSKSSKHLRDDEKSRSRDKLRR